MEIERDERVCTRCERFRQCRYLQRGNVEAWLCSECWRFVKMAVDWR